MVALFVIVVGDGGVVRFFATPPRMDDSTGRNSVAHLLLFCAGLPRLAILQAALNGYNGHHPICSGGKERPDRPETGKAGPHASRLFHRDVRVLWINSNQQRALRAQAKVGADLPFQELLLIDARVLEASVRSILRPTPLHQNEEEGEEEEKGHLQQLLGHLKGRL